MKKRGNRKKKRIVFAIVNGALLLIMAACLITTAILSNTLASQKEASRWRGESDMEFSQISCFIPVDEKIKLEVKRIDPEPTERDAENRLTWKFSLKPGETRKIVVEYTLTYPSGETLEYR